MKKVLLALTIFTMASACLLALNNTASRKWQQLRAKQTAWLTETQQLAEVETEGAALTAKIRELKRELRGSSAAPMDTVVVDFLLTHDVRSVSLQMQDALLGEFGRGGNSSGNYVLVSKAALTNTAVGSLMTSPNCGKLTDAVCGILAITPEERKSVEAVFTEILKTTGAWAKANVQREGASDDMIARYTIPADPAFGRALTDRLFSTVNAAIGDERSNLLHKYFDHGRIDIDGRVADRTNILSVHRISEPPGFGYRAGWKWENSEAINTYPEPIKPENFPTAFRFIFPGGWQEVAQRESFDLPEEFNKKP